MPLVYQHHWLHFTWHILPYRVSNLETFPGHGTISVEIYEERAVRKDVTGQKVSTESADQFCPAARSTIHIDLITARFCVKT